MSKRRLASHTARSIRKSSRNGGQRRVRRDGHRLSRKPRRDFSERKANRRLRNRTAGLVPARYCHRDGKASRLGGRRTMFCWQRGDCPRLRLRAVPIANCRVAARDGLSAPTPIRLVDLRSRPGHGPHGKVHRCAVVQWRSCGERPPPTRWPTGILDRSSAARSHQTPAFRERLRFTDPLFRPQHGDFGNPIPFFWKGQYHVFYLMGGQPRCTWEHIIWTNLGLHWRELPRTALKTRRSARRIEQGDMATGSVDAEGWRVSHIFYCGQNLENPRGSESVLHATSADLSHWTKRPSGPHRSRWHPFSNKPVRDFRDAYVFWKPDEQLYWMVVQADALTARGPGLLVSRDLTNWRQLDGLAISPRRILRPFQSRCLGICSALILTSRQTTARAVSSCAHRCRPMIRHVFAPASGCSTASVTSGSAGFWDSIRGAMPVVQAGAARSVSRAKSIPAPAASSVIVAR